MPIPESIVIGGVTYPVATTPELQELMKEVSKVEKDKLYSKFEDLKKQVTELGGATVTTETSGLDVNSLVSKLSETFVTKTDLSDVVSNSVKEVVQPMLNATAQSRKQQLEEFRNKLIKEHESTCIPDLVKGESEEEIRKNLEYSIKLRKQYPSPVPIPNQPVDNPTPAPPSEQTPTPAPEVPAPAPQETPAPAPAPQETPQQVPPVPNRPAPPANAPTSVKSMSMGEFSKQRAQLLADIEKQFG